MKKIIAFLISLFIFIAAHGQIGIYPQSTASGTNDYTTTVTPSFSAYTVGQRFPVKFPNGNTVPATININGKGVVDIVRSGTIPLTAGDISPGQILLLVYDGFNMQIVGGGNGSVNAAFDSVVNRKANLSAPIFTDAPRAPTATFGTSNDEIANAQFVQDAIATPVVAFNSELTFDYNKHLATITGGTTTFTLAATGHKNGVKIVARVNDPDAVNFPAGFEQKNTSNSLTTTGMNLITFELFEDYDALGNDKVFYDISRQTLVGTGTPDTQASSLVISDQTDVALTLTWTKGDGIATVIIGKKSSAVNSLPVDGTDYTANTVFGSGSQLGTGNFVVYNDGPQNTVVVTGLDASSTYHFRAFERNGLGATSKYITSTATGNPTSGSTDPPAAFVYDTEAQAYFDRVEAATGVITDANKHLWNDFVLTIKALDQWDNFKEIGCPILSANASITPALIKAKYPGGKSASVTNTNFAAANYTLAGAFKGDANSDRSLRTDMIVNDLTFDNFHAIIGYNLLAEETLNAAKLFGVPSGEFQMSWATSNLRLNTYANSAASGQVISSINGNAGVEIFNSTAANSFIQYHGGIQTASSSTVRSAFSETAPINLFWLGSGNSHFSGYEWFYSFGTAFDPAKIPAIDAAIRTLLTGLGRDWGNVFFEGDATVFGTGTTTGSYASRTMKEAGGRLGQFNSGTVNHTIATINSNKSSEYPTRLQPGDIYYLHAGYHDLNTGRTANETWVDVESIFDYLHTLSIFNGVVATLPGSPDYSPAEDLEREAFNSLIREKANVIGYAVADFAIDPDIGTANVTNFNGNQNFNNAGALIAARIAGAAVLSVSQYTNATPAVTGNRIATEADRTLYGSFITVGDLIVDTPTLTNADGSHNATYYFMGTQWPTLSGSPTIWLDGDGLCPGGEILNEIKFQNTSNNNTPWSINTATFKNIPGTKVLSKTFVCNGLLNLTIEGEGTIQGMYDEFQAGTRHLSQNYFGIHIINSLFNGHGVAGTVRNGGSISLSGIEIQHGFSGVRLMATAGVEVTVANLTIHDLYIHDTLSEAFYLGSTKGGNQAIPLFADGEIYNVIICRSGGESLQFQNFAGIDCHNITILNADMDWVSAFQPYQDSGIQYVVNGGENKLRNILMHGYGSTAILPFGTPVFSYVPQSVNTTLIENCLFSEGRSIGMYFNNACSNGVTWNLEDLTFIDFNATYYTQTGVVSLPHIIESGPTRSDIVNINDLTHDGTKTRVLGDDNDYNDTNIVLNSSQPAPLFQNYGFSDVKNVMRWSRYWGNYFQNIADNTPVVWTIGQYVQYIDETASTIHFYKARTTHSATATTPPNDTTNWLSITWDQEGDRSDAVGWDVGDTQSIYPPDYVRLQAGSPYATMGIELN